MKRTIELIIFLALALPASAFSPEGKGALHGMVKDKATGQGIPGAEVYFPDLHTGAMTDTAGAYSIQDLPLTKALVKVSMIGYATITRTVDLALTDKFDVALSESVTEMHDVVVTGTSKATELRRDPVAITMVSRNFLRENAATNIIGTLAKVPGVSAVSTGPNVSKPYIRGLGGNRVLTLYDGIRQEGQQWGEEHGVEVDPYMIDRVEVVKGPASLMYGSDALAGVVNLIPAPPVPPGTWSGAVLSDFGTNNKGLAASLNMDGNNGKLFFGGRFTGRAASNYRNRIDGPVYGTKSAENDLSAYIGVNRSWGFAKMNFSLYDSRMEIPDGSRDSTTRRFTYQIDEADTLRPVASEGMLNSYTIAPLHQRVQYYRAYATANFILGDARLTTEAGFLRSIRREYVHPGSPGLPGLYLILNTFPFDLKYHFAERSDWASTVGLNGMFQTNDAAKGTELLIPDDRQFDIGPFVHVKRSFGTWDLSGGVRHDVRLFRNEAMYTRTDPATGFEMSADAEPGDTSVTKQFDAYKHVFQGTSASIGATWNPNDRITVKANVGKGYRAPGVAETTAKGVHPGSGLMQLGDADLVPETNVQGDLGLFYSGTHVSASVEVFNNTILNYIYNEKLAASGDGDSLYVQGAETYPVFKFRQTSAWLRGGEVRVDIHPHPFDDLHFENAVSFVIAENRGGGGAVITDSTRYLPMIPPLHTTSELRYDLRKPMACFARIFLKVGVQVHSAQDRFFSAYGTETFTPGYTLLDAAVGGDVVDRAGHTLFTFTIIGSNLADVAYQSNMSRLKYFDDYPVNGTGRSGIYDMGRNFSIKVVVPFNLRKRATPQGS